MILPHAIRKYYLYLYGLYDKKLNQKETKYRLEKLIAFTVSIFDHYVNAGAHW